LARSFPFELGLPPAWRLTDEIEETRLREQAVDAMIASLGRAEMTTLMSMLGKGEIRRSVANELLQVIEDAYSSQRRCPVEVWDKLSVPKLPNDRQLQEAVSAFRAAEPKQKRHRDKLADLADLLESGQFESLAEETLVANIAQARRTRTPLTYYRSTFPDGLEEAFETLYLAAQSAILSLLRAQNLATGTVLKSYDAEVTQLKQSSRMLGFEDVGVRLADRFGKFNDSELSTRMDGAVNHLLLDEFQDTSAVQWQVLFPFASRVAIDQPATSSGDDSSVKRSFFCVGDTKQAIYGWRGGVAEIFDSVTEQLPSVKTYPLNTSFRSSPVIMQVVNETFKNLPRHPLATAAQSSDLSDKSMHEAQSLVAFARRFPQHLTERMQLPGHACLQTSRLVRNGDAESRRMTCFEDAAQQIAELAMRAPQVSIGVLTRTNQGVADLIFLLEQRGLDVSQEGGNPLTDSAAVEMLLSALMLAEHPGDGRWAFHLSETPLVKIPGFGPDYVRTLAEERGLAETVELLAGKLAPLCDSRDTLRLKQLCHLALGYESQSQSWPRIQDFVRMVQETRVDRPQPAPIRVMTVHQAKGLEFDAVFLAELDGALTRSRGNCVADIRTLGEAPRAMSRYIGQDDWHFLGRDWQQAFGRQASANLTEALCLLYVAMTRARQSLQMIIQPASKPAFESHTAASLLFHALAPSADPTQEQAILYEQGQRDWFDTKSREKDMLPPNRRTRKPPR
jgi:ATP-dependent exoDNAse (exonuclease V) beta subunit